MRRNLLALVREPVFRTPAIDQNAPLPTPAPGEALPGEYGAAEIARRARMEQALPSGEKKSPPYRPPPYQWGGLHGISKQNHVAALKHLAGLGGVWCMHKDNPPQRAPRGFGAGGASAFTMTAAQALNDHLDTNNCAGCNDMTSQLRQLTFAFKAAYLTDTGIAPQVNLNMSSALAMTAYGPGTDQALALVLGAAKSYTNGPCTDDSGNCLGKTPTPIIPPAVSALEQQIVKAIMSAIQQAQFLPQPELVNGLVQGFAALVNQIGFELAKLNQPKDGPTLIVDKTDPTKTVVVTTPPKEGWTTGEKIAAGVGAGVALTAVALLVYNVAKRS